MGRLTRAAVLAIVLVCLTAGPAAAQGVPQTFTVNSQTDATDSSPDGNCSAVPPAAGACTLRAAIQEANRNAVPDTIVLPAGTYGLTVPTTAENAAADGDLDITAPVTINGAGARTTMVQQSV